MSTASTTPRDALVAQLERLYYIEQRLQSALRTLSADVSIDSLDDLRALECREQLQYVIDGHREESERHLERIERAFDALDTEPDSRPVPELDGLIADKEAFNNVVLNDAIRPLYYIQTVLQLEAIECTVYETTMALATELEVSNASETSRTSEDAIECASEVVDALQDSYDDERQVRSEIESLLDGEAVETLLEAHPVNDTSREPLDRSWRDQS